MSQSAPSVPVAAHPKIGYSIFDIEIHARPSSPQDVARYLPASYAARYLDGFLGDSTPNLDQRGGNDREDADASDGCPAASNPELIARQLLDPYGIEWAICTGPIYNLSTIGDTDYAVALATAYNRWLNEDFVPRDPRFYGVINVAMQDPRAAVKEIERWAGHPRMSEVFIGSAGVVPLGHRSNHIVYEAAAANGFPVATHSTMEGRGITGTPTGNGYCSRYIEYHTGLAASALTNVASLVCEGVFAKIPNFKFVLLEFGISWAQPLMWALDREWKHLRSEMPLLKELPSEYLKRQLFYTTQPIEEPENTRDLVQTFHAVNGDNQIMFSSDYPHWDFDNPVVILPGRDNAALKRRILRDNALALYGQRLGLK
ncbi:MAG: amidohydrolase [Magnetospirillum sp.]|nr:amidohydrolase [Magnetospirillum sp.]